MKLKEPRVSKIIDGETGSVLVKTTWDNSHDVGGWDYEFVYCDEDGGSYNFETRVQFIPTASRAYRKENPNIKGFIRPGFDEFEELFYKKNHMEYQTVWFDDKTKVDDIIYEKAARKFCEMYLRLHFSYELNHKDYEPGMDGSYLGKIYFYASPRNRLPSFQMEVGSDD